MVTLHQLVIGFTILEFKNFNLYGSIYNVCLRENPEGGRIKHQLDSLEK